MASKYASWENAPQNHVYPITKYSMSVVSECTMALRISQDGCAHGSFPLLKCRRPPPVGSCAGSFLADRDATPSALCACSVPKSEPIEEDGDGGGEGSELAAPTRKLQLIGRHVVCAQASPCSRFHSLKRSAHSLKLGGQRIRVEKIA